MLQVNNDLAVPYEVLSGEFLRINITCPDYSGCLPFKIAGESNQTTGLFPGKNIVLYCTNECTIVEIETHVYVLTCTCTCTLHIDCAVFYS